ncbi:expressed unknown protein [Seminavis robusta]|uniref:Uncharacterized protein n=1 Tax=Seminavis robusta TaxID=568900 RepID=A0A9N8H8B0_9STRA|nr:expressed unknown protein [Seminavis robusta]|eukprot:Sro233_g094260.1 n/a (195) ;mRNA; f:67863-68541
MASASQTASFVGTMSAKKARFAATGSVVHTGTTFALQRPSCTRRLVRMPLVDVLSARETLIVPCQCACQASTVRSLCARMANALTRLITSRDLNASKTTIALSLVVDLDTSVPRSLAKEVSVLRMNLFLALKTPSCARTDPLSQEQVLIAALLSALNCILSVGNSKIVHKFAAGWEPLAALNITVTWREAFVLI